ncbi:MAG: response regulator [Lachnospiraceae bacterium]|nr:response regulator [Lachnospiraceae bacterium]
MAGPGRIRGGGPEGRPMSVAGPGHGGRRLPDGRPPHNGMRKGPGGSSLIVMAQVMLVCTLVCGIFMALLNRGLYEAAPVPVFISYLFFFTLPLMFVSSLYGFPIGAICFLLVEIMGMLSYFDRLYVLSYHLIALFMTNAFMLKGIYKSFRKTLVLILLSALAEGLTLFIIWELAADLTLESWHFRLLPRALLVAGAERAFSYFFLYCLFRYAPIGLVRLFPPGLFRHEFRPKPQGMGFTERGPSVLGQRIGRYMIIEAMLIGLGVAGFVNQLLPTLQLETGHQVIFLAKIFLCVFAESVPIVVAVNFLVHNKIINPLRSMTKGMQVFAGQGGDARLEAQKFIEGMDLKTGDELETLYHAMSDMVAEVNRYIKRIEEEQKLEEDLRVAKAASEAKTNFMSHMSHEIRTPINAVIGMDEMIIRETNEQSTLHYARDIRNAGRSLLGIVNDILDFSRIESGKLEIIPEEYELSTVLNDLMSIIYPKAREKQLDFKIDADPDIPRKLFGDDMRIKQCALNLLTNAVKYTQEGKVRLKVSFESISEEKIAMEVRVTDTGIGIKQEDIPKLIKPFERIEEERNRTIEGTGLGMSITANLLELMGSKLQVVSEYGRGSTFWFVVEQDVVTNIPIGDFAKDYETMLSREERYREKFRAPDARILVVDDTRTNLTVIKGLLKETEIQVDTAASGREMLDMVVRYYYDAIFLDQRMPLMDGIEALHLMELLSERKNPDVPVVALTANVVSGAREMFLSEGFSDYLSKPVDPGKLEGMLIKYLPEDKVMLTGIVPEREEAGEEAAEDPVVARLKDTEGIDYEEAIARCMNDEILIDTLRDFRRSAMNSPEEIRQFLKDGNIKDYTIKVHALKSGAALVGAGELSAMAARLEKAGDEGDLAVIERDTPELLALYSSYADRLAFLEEEEDEEAPEIEEDKLHEAYAAIREFLEAFDLDGAEDVLDMLKAFSIPKNEKKRYNELKQRIKDLDCNAALEILKGEADG